jgi:VanZ family protein
MEDSFFGFLFIGVFFAVGLGGGIVAEWPAMKPAQRDAGWVGIAVLVIWLTIPFARRIQRLFESAFGEHAYAVAAVLGAVFLIIIVLSYLLRRRKRRVLRRVAWLALLLVASALVLRHQLQTPAEAIHFFEYGILALLLFRALRHHMPDRMIYPVALVLLTLLAALDEMIQWALPGRYWDYRDVRLNVLAGAIVLFFIALVINPSGIDPRPARRSVRWFCRVAWAGLALLLVVTANTPSRVDLYGSRIPLLRFLVNNESVMTEYGHRHTEPGIGTFYSRFTRAELARLDAERGAEAGELVRRYDVLLDYREFLRRFTASSDPFVHEFRVHLYRRDHYLATAWKYREDDPERWVYHLTVADRENRLLELLFPVTLAAAGVGLEEAARVELAGWADPDRVYVSPVSDHLVTRAGEWEVRLALALAAGLIGWIYVRYGRERVAAVG